MEREGLSSTHPDTLSGGLGISLDTRFASLPKFSDRANYPGQSNDFDLKRCGDCETTCRLYRFSGVNSLAAPIASCHRPLKTSCRLNYVEQKVDESSVTRRFRSRSDRNLR